jgi:TetR/AcrR family transcriptional regulator, transcriptional repressor for nem operon
MKVSREKADQNRELVLETAGKLFREYGFDGVGVADLMKNAGLTVGGFYKNFSSKEDLMVKTCKKIADQSQEKLMKLANDPNVQNPYAQFGASYLSTKNRDNLSSTCMFSTLANEVQRHDKALNEVFYNNLSALFEYLEPMVPVSGDEDRKKKAMTTFSMWLGALILSRLTSETELSEDILNAVKQMTGIQAASGQTPE